MTDQAPDVEVIQEATASPETQPESNDWLKRGREAFRFSTSYLDSNYRKAWEDSIRAFNNQHPTDSKYASANYDKRSRIYRPKARSVIRKNEAAAAAAFFSNMDVVNIEAENSANPMQRASAEVMKQLISYRLAKSVPWFLVVLGGLQDAQVQGAACAHVYWHYDDISDKPCVDLIPLENMRIDPGASWVDPIGTSPYLIHMIPMYVGDVKERMRVPDKAGRTWKHYEDGYLRAATKTAPDTTRMTRNDPRQDPLEDNGQPVSDYEIVWVQRHIHRRGGLDWHFYMLGEVALLSDPEPLRDVVFHGMRPYVMGRAILETHKTMPASVPKLMEGLSSEANEIANQRLDNVKFVMNKGYRVKRGSNADLAAMVRNVPGRIVLTNDPEHDIVEETWPDVTSSAYAEQERIDNDANELIGNFSPMDLPNRKGAETARGMQLLMAPSISLVEYLLRTYVETFIEPILRQLVKLEAYYETDETVMALAAEKAKLFQRYGVNQVTDQMLNQDLSVRVNVGMGATDPNTKLQKIIGGVTAFVQIAKEAPPGLNVGEVGKEIFGFMGYPDGARFFGGEDPEKARLQAQLQQMQQMLQVAAGKLKEKRDATMATIATAKIKSATDIAKTAMIHRHENRQLLAEALMQSHPALQPPEPAGA